MSDTLRFHTDRLEDRTVDELIGISKGLIADGDLNKKEIEFLCQWLESNKAYADMHPIDVLYERIKDMLADNVIDDEERLELFDILTKITGGTKLNENIQSFSSTLPLTNCTCIEFEQKVFCFTGTFSFGNRKCCEQAILNLGAIPAKSITKKLHYLVIGDIGTEDWIHSTFGRKIEKALAYNKAGTGIHIISEEEWANALIK